MQDALIGGIRELVDAVKGLNIEKLSGSGADLAVPAPETAEAARPDEDTHILELYRTIEDLRRRNEELQKSLEQAEKAAEALPAPATPESGAPEADIPEPLSPEAEDDLWDQIFDDLPADDLWGDTEDESEAAPAAPETGSDAEDSWDDDVWDLEPIPPTEEDLMERARAEREAQSILARSATLISGMSVLERMTARGETVMDITLEDLVAQIEYESKRA